MEGAAYRAFHKASVRKKSASRSPGIDSRPSSGLENRHAVPPPNEVTNLRTIGCRLAQPAPAFGQDTTPFTAVLNWQAGLKKWRLRWGRGSERTRFSHWAGSL